MNKEIHHCNCKVLGLLRLSGYENFEKRIPILWRYDCVFEARILQDNFALTLRRLARQLTCISLRIRWFHVDIKQLLDEFEHHIMNYQNRGLCYLPKPKAEADNTDLGFDNS